MAGKRKGAVGMGKGSMCNICGLNCGKGGPLSKHVKAVHRIEYEDYKTCFEGDGTTLVDKWIDTGGRNKGTPVLIHVLVRRVVNDPGERGVAR